MLAYETSDTPEVIAVYWLSARTWPDPRHEPGGRLLIRLLPSSSPHHRFGHYQIVPLDDIGVVKT